MLSRISAIAALFLVTSCASMMVESPDGRYGPDAGENEITFAGTLSSQSFDFGAGPSMDTKTLNGQVGVGRFLTDNWEYGGQVIFGITDPDGGSESINIGVAPYGRYNWRANARTWYYAGLQLSYQKFEASGSDDSAIGYGAHGGIKTWLSPEVSFFIEPRINFTDFTFGAVDAELDEFTTLFGFAFVF